MMSIANEDLDNRSVGRVASGPGHQEDHEPASRNCQAPATVEAVVKALPILHSVPSAPNLVEQRFRGLFSH